MGFRLFGDASDPGDNRSSHIRMIKRRHGRGVIPMKVNAWDVNGFRAFPVHHDVGLIGSTR